MVSTNQLVDETAVAKMCGVSVGLIRKWRFQGHGGPPYVKLGSAVRYGVGDIEAFLKAARVEPGQGQR